MTPSPTPTTIKPVIKTIIPTSSPGSTSNLEVSQDSTNKSSVFNVTTLTPDDILRGQNTTGFTPRDADSFAPKQINYDPNETSKEQSVIPVAEPLTNTNQKGNAPGGESVDVNNIAIYATITGVIALILVTMVIAKFLHIKKKRYINQGMNESF